MPTPRPHLISREVAVLGAVLGLLSLAVAAMVVIGLRNHETHSHDLESTITDSALKVEIAPASLVPAEE